MELIKHWKKQRISVLVKMLQIMQRTLMTDLEFNVDCSNNCPNISVIGLKQLEVWGGERIRGYYPPPEQESNV